MTAVVIFLMMMVAVLFLMMTEMRLRRVMSFFIMILMMISIVVSVIPMILVPFIPLKSLMSPFPLSQMVRKRGSGLLLEIVTMLVMVSWSLVAVSVDFMVSRGVVSPMIVVLSMMIHLVPLVSSFLGIVMIS